MNYLLELFQTGVKNANLSTLGTDMHSHLLPGIDDGAKTLDDSLDLIRTFHKLGYRRIITTPHVMSELYPNSRQTILEKKALVQEALNEAGIDIEFEASAEYYLDEQFRDLLEANELLPFAGNYILVEMGFIDQPPNLHNNLFRLQTKGYTPILAHPERYGFYRSDLKKYEQLKELGCLFQLNLLSLSGYYGSGPERTADKLLRAGLIDFLGTDCHNASQLVYLQEALESRAYRRLLSAYTFQNSSLSA